MYLSRFATTLKACCNLYNNIEEISYLNILYFANQITIIMRYTMLINRKWWNGLYTFVTAFYEGPSCFHEKPPRGKKPQWRRLASSQILRHLEICCYGDLYDRKFIHMKERNYIISANIYPYKMQLATNYIQHCGDSFDRKKSSEYKIYQSDYQILFTADWTKSGSLDLTRGILLPFQTFKLHSIHEIGMEIHGFRLFSGFVHMRVLVLKRASLAWLRQASLRSL